MPLTIISDIDGTTVRTSPARVTLLSQGRWDEFAKGAINDPPVKSVVRMLQLCYQRGIQIHLVTGRGEECRSVTEEWLWKWNVPFQSLRMRPEDDRTPGYELKRRWLAEGNYQPAATFAVFEDQTAAVRMYRQRGFLTFQVRQDPVEDHTLLASVKSRLAALA